MPRPLFANDKTTEASPLGPSYVLLPLPGDDDGLLGRVLPALPEQGRALDEIARPNPCEAHLEEARETALSNHFEDAQDVSGSARAGAIFSSFGISADVSHATHFVYRLDTQKKITRRDTTAYEACCQEQDCGFGYITSLVYGTGEYASGEETNGGAKANVYFVSGEGRTRLRVLRKRKVKGYLAAVVRITDTDAAAQLTPFGAGEMLGITEDSLSDIVKQVYEREKIEVVTDGESYRFKDGHGETMSENEFIRRYRSVTNSDELDDVQRRRNWGWLIPSATVTAASAAVTAAGAYLHVHHYQDRSNPDADGGKEGMGSFLLAIGAPTLVLSGISTTFLVASDWSADGSEIDHEITELDGRLLVAEYNRTLLRRAIRKASKQRSAGIQIRPQVGLGSVGLSGSF